MTQPSKLRTPADLLRTAAAALQRGNIYVADAVCQDLLERGVILPLGYEILARVAQQVGDGKRMGDYLKRRIAMGGASPAVKQAYAEAIALAAPPTPAAPRYLVIKPWGSGFCSDLVHALSGVFLAETTGRTPVIWWDGRSMFRDEGVANAWTSFFLPVSEMTLDDALAAGGDFFPPKWNRTNIREPGVNLDTGDWSRMAFLHYLNRPEAIAVLDYHCAVINILPWLPEGHPSHGSTVEAAHRRLVREHLKPTNALIRRADEFADAHFAGRRMLAVHVRGSDKVLEDPELHARNARFIPHIESHLAAADAGVFLLTDSAAVIDDYRRRFGERVVTTPAVRSSTDQGVHFMPGLARSRLGEEVVLDLLLGAKCDRLLVGGTSNVSSMLLYMKEWDEAAVTRIGPRFHEQRYYFFYP